MMKWTDRYCRVFHRCLTKKARLYTEMLTANAVIHGKRQKLLAMSPIEHPIALQLGGSDPETLANAAKIGEEWGYDEINLNCGCPSERVQTGAFGACLMREPETVAECVAAMQAAVSIPVSIKCRIGLDADPPCLFEFVRIVSEAGCCVFIVHARKAWLKGLDPKQNRLVPPLDYERVADLKQARPDLQIILNGGITSLPQMEQHLTRFDGVMIGRAAYQNPALLGHLDAALFASKETCDSFQAATAYRSFIAEELLDGTPLHAMTRHMMGLFAGYSGARTFRRILSEKAPGARGEQALAIYDEALSAPATAFRDVA